MKGLAYNVDSLMFKRGAWRIYGWCVAEDGPIAGIKIRYSHLGGIDEQSLTIGGVRPDVAYHVKGNRFAANSGFLGFGNSPARMPYRVELEVSLADGRSILLDITRFLSDRSSAIGALKTRIGYGRALMKQRQYRLLAGKSLQYLRRSFTGGRRVQIGETARPGDNALPVSIIFDHSMGGGANVFSQTLAAQLSEKATQFYVVRYSIERLSFQVDYYGQDGVKTSFEFETHDALAGYLKQLTVAEIYVNSTVSYPSNRELLKTIADLSKGGSAPVHFYFHDYYSVCPSFTLIDNQGRYCSVPTEGTCNGQCLPRHNDPFVVSQRVDDIGEWRRDWSAFLAVAAEIRFFSEESFSIFRKAFPTFDTTKCFVLPHPASELSSVPLRPSKTLTIAVIGSVNYAKGAGVVEELCSYIKEKEIDVRIVVIGTLERAISENFLKVTGPYSPQDLPKILARVGASVALFPSIWPETFSFVVSELEAIHIPIVAFDVGAPAERLRKSKMADLLPLGSSPKTILDTLSRRALPSVVTDKTKPPAKICVFTSAATNYLPKVMMLGQSLKKFHPEIDLVYCLCDRLYPDVDYLRGVFDDVVPIEDLEIEDFESWSFKHSIVELSTAVKPFMLKSLLSKGYEQVLYFDPDIVLFSRVDDLIEAGAASSVILTPHQTSPEIDYQAVIDNEIGSLKHGIYNLGFVGVKSTPEGREFTNWWAARVYEWCRDDIPNGLFTDQRWIDLAPALFDDIKILRQSRFNVSTWNLTKRNFEGSLENGFVVDGTPLGFYHFTGFDSGAHRVMAEKNSRHNPAVMNLVDWYERETRLDSQDPASKAQWAYGYYSDGDKVERSHRLIYTERKDLQIAFPQPFRGGPNEGLRGWLRTQGKIEYPEAVDLG
ncbi:glycosyltransferase [Mesorhizobium sp. M0053]|uniref:glycosyltransferase n=1 Tax=Mesorhizobium sp. M0053 TaxID=2956864 RepID=UPI00333A8A4C